MSKRLKIFPGYEDIAIILKSMINSKLAELAVLEERIITLGSKDKLRGDIFSSGHIVSTNDLSNMMLEKDRIQAQIDSLLISLKKIDDSEVEWVDSDDKEAEADQLISIFHRLWTKSVGTTGYVKKEWQQLQKFLLKRGIVT